MQSDKVVLPHGLNQITARRVPPRNDLAGCVLLHEPHSVKHTQLDEFLQFALEQLLAVRVHFGRDHKWWCAPLALLRHCLDSVNIQSEGVELDPVQFELSNHAPLEHPKLVLGDSVGLGDHRHKIHSLVDQLHVEDIDWLELVQYKVKGAGWQGVGFGASDQEPGQLGR